MKPFRNILLAYDVIGQSALGSRGVRNVVAGLDSDPRFRWRAAAVSERTGLHGERDVVAALPLWT